MELTGFSRFHLTGEGAANWLASLITGNLPQVGRIGLVYFASAKGKVLTEMSATRLAEDEFLLITGAGAYWHDRDLLNGYLPKSGGITLQDTTRDHATLLVTGPKSPAIIAAATGLSTAPADFPWLSHQSCQIAGCRVTAIRVSFAGEAGWEIHCDMADVVAVYDAIMAAGAPYKLGHFGMLALDSMRLEKGYRSWKSDLTSDYTMLESGLGRWVKFDKADFVGRAALQAEHQAGSQRQFVTLTLDDPADDNADPFGEAPGTGGCVEGSNLCRGRIPLGVSPSHLLVKRDSNSAWALWSFDGSAKANAFLQAAQSHQAVNHQGGSWTPIASSGHGWGCSANCRALIYSSTMYILDDDTHWCNPAFKMGATYGSGDSQDYGYLSAGCGTRVGGEMLYLPS